MRKTVMLMVVLLFFLGCAVIPPTPEQIANADYGGYPADYKKAVEGFMNNILIDSQSAIYSHWKGPAKGWRENDDNGYIFGYIVCVDVNAKNRMGGYGGRKTFWFLFQGNEILHYATEEGAPTEEWCNF